MTRVPVRADREGAGDRGGDAEVDGVGLAVVAEADEDPMVADGADPSSPQPATASARAAVTTAGRTMGRG
jgi:hypothetical protein